MNSNQKINSIPLRENRNPPKFKGELCNVEIFIDRQLLKNLLKDMAQDNGFHWQEENDMVVCLESLQESVDKAGKFPILVGSHCLMNGLVDPADISPEFDS